jgi:hypothetical protein
MIAPGAIVRVYLQGDTAWVVRGKTLDGSRWRVTCKDVDAPNRAALSARVVGEGDIVLIKPAPTYEPGSTITHNGVAHTVARDLGDEIELIVPASRFPTKGGDHLLRPAGNHVTIPKSDLVLETLQ